MRKVIFLITIIVLQQGCKKDDPIVIDIPDDYYKNGVYITIDPRIELLAVVQHFTTWADKHHTNMNFGYVNEAEDYFSSFSQDPAVEKCQDLIDLGFSYDAPVTFMLYHNYPPEFNRLLPYTDYLSGRAAGETNLNDFAGKLREFYQSSGFVDFYNDHKTFYDKTATLIFNTLGDNNYVDIMEDYYGETKHKYIIIPVPIFTSEGYGPKIDFPEGQYVYSIIGASGLRDDIPTFGNESYFKHIVLHEFGHSFVNPVTAEYINEIYQSDELFDPIKTQMEDQAYGTWHTCVNEHLVRINVIRMKVLTEGESVKNGLLDFEISKGFIYISQLDTLMQRYESSRPDYPAWSDFYPEIINLFNTLAGIE